MQMFIRNSEIKDINTWPRPKSPEIQWKDGRSAKELAKYITKNLPLMPAEIEDYLNSIIEVHQSNFDFDAEVVTKFSSEKFGRGSGRNHDAIIYNDELFIGIEAKADESLDRTIKKWVEGGTTNRLTRIQALSEMIFGDSFENHLGIRYQLLTALGGVLLEAKARNTKTAILLVIVFKKSGLDGNGKSYYCESKVKRNEEDIRQFLESLNYNNETGKVITKFGLDNGIDTYVKEIVITI